MKINVIKRHFQYGLKEYDVTDERGNYLISIGVAEKVKDADPAKANDDPATDPPNDPPFIDPPATDPPVIDPPADDPITEKPETKKVPGAKNKK